MAKDVQIKPNPEAVRLLRKITSDDLKQFSELCLVHSREACPVDTGTLKRSLVAEKESETTFVLKSRTGYGAAVHFGTTKMVARPFFAQGVDAATPVMWRIIQNRNTYRE